MTDDRKPARRPFGDRDDEERQRPFGASRPVPERPTPPPERPAEDSRTPSPEPTAPPEPPDDEVEQPPDAQPRFSRPFGPTTAADSSRTRRDNGGLRIGPRPEYRPLEDYYEDQREDEPFVPEPDPADEDEPPTDERDLQPTPAAPRRKPPERPPLQFGVMLRTVVVVLLLSGVLASVFTWWTPNAFLSSESMDQLSVALATQSSLMVPPPPTATPEPTPVVTPSPTVPPIPRIGVVAGHRGTHPSSGEPDPGAVCDDGLTEAEVNLAVAELVVEWLGETGYEVDLLDEFDARLNGYQADALVSIHADSCEYINDIATGFKVASFSESTTPDSDARLVGCLIDRYGTTTGLPLHNSVTFDMTQYHSFREVAPGTPGAIIEVGFLYMDRDLLTQSPDVIALGVARGILCYLRDEPIEPEIPVPTVEMPEDASAAEPDAP